MQDVRVCPRCHRINAEAAALCIDCGGSLHGAVTTVPDAEIIRPGEPPAPADGMPCPACGTAMDTGESFIHIPMPALLWNWNVLVLRLVFRLQGRREHRALMEYGEKRHSARCRECGGVWISRLRST